MSRINVPDGAEVTFRDSYLREFDTALLSMHPAERAGYLENAYITALQGRFAPEFLREMAQLLKKWGTRRSSFESHAQKLLALAEKIEQLPAGRDADERADSGVYDLRGNSHALVNKVLSSPPGPISDSSDGEST